MNISDILCYATVFAILNAAQPAFAKEKPAQESAPQFTHYPVDQRYSGRNHPLLMDSFGKEYKTRLRDAIALEKPEFAGHYIVAGWGCGTGGCNTGAMIDAITGQAYPFPVAMSSVYPLKSERQFKESVT